MSNPLRLLLSAVLLALFLAVRVQADPTAAAAAPAAPPVASLADALAALPDTSIADGSVVLTVQPASVMPVPNMPPEDAETVPTPDTLAERYGRSLQVFSHIIALAPPTMTVLNTDPALATLPLGNLAGQHPETYLLGSLTPVQLRQAGTAGLAYADMTPDQQSLLHALLPEPLEIVPLSASYPDDKMDTAQRADFDAQTQKISGDALLNGLRFHAYLTGDYYVHAPVGYGIGDTRELLETTGAFKLLFSGYRNMDSRGKSTENLLRADVPNSPKVGDLVWNRRDLEHTVSLDGLKTVDELVTRLARVTGLELYADPHYASLPALARGDLKTRQPAGDVMQALALCVCGTWRQVGPAYVLTDDMQGLGTRQAFLAEIGQVWSNRLTEGGRDAGSHLQALDWMHALSFVPGDIGALSPSQIDAIQKQDGTNKGTLSWKSLPPALQDHLRDIFLHYGESLPKQAPESIRAEFAKMGDEMKAAAESITPNTPVETTLNVRLAVELPSTGAMMLYGDYKVQPPDPDAAKADAPAKAAAPAQAGSIVLNKPLRGVLCAPKTPDEARAVVAKLTKMGFNTLFLDVFTGGRTYFPNSAFPPASEASGSVLQAALDAAKPLHTAVYAVMDTLCWRKDCLTPHPQPWPSGYAEDLTISGETPDHVVQRRYAAHSLSTDYDHPRYLLARQGNESWASPLDPAVQTLLPALAQSLAATPGLAGLIFQDTEPPGYNGDGGQESLELGYTPENRLAYLRAVHRDPLDLGSGFGDMVSVFVGGESFFGHYEIGIPTFASNQDDYAVWMRRRADADRTLLANCWYSAHAAAPTLPLLRGGASVAPFEPWMDPQPKTQVNPEPGRSDPARRLTLSSILDLPFGPDEQAHPDRFLRNAQFGSVSGWGYQAGGEVFDLVTGGAPDHLLDTLDKLNVFLKKPQKNLTRQ